MSRPIAYLTGQYPRATDTFIQREVAALRAQGLTVETCSVRDTGPAHLVGPEQRAAAEDTFYILARARNPLRLIRAHARALAMAPRRYGRALVLAWRTAPPGLRGALWQAFYLAEAGILAEHLDRIRARHLHNHIAEAAGTVAMLAAEMAGIGFSFTLHGPGIFDDVHRWRLDEKIARARFVACISHYARAQAMRLSPPEMWPKLAIVHCGVEPRLYGREACAPESTSGPNLIFVGRLAAVKGVPILLEALSALAPDYPGLRLTLAGDGPDRAALEAQARELGLSDMVRFTGYAAQSEIAEMLACADIFVLPSFAEGVPVVLMEAMATGLPVIATQVGGVAELVRDGAGILVAPGDVDALAAAIADLLDDPERRARMGQAGAAIVARDFDSRVEAARLARLIDEASP